MSKFVLLRPYFEEYLAGIELLLVVWRPYCVSFYP
jgi:hypothetical protein